MRSFCIVLPLFCFTLTVTAQKLSYNDSLEKFQKNYVSTHEIVKGSDTGFFRFFEVNEKYRIVAIFVKITDTTGFVMKTTGQKKSTYLRYGLLKFTVNKIASKLTVYQSKQLMADAQYRNYLFVPFTDLSSGEKSYAGGRYLDFVLEDIQNNRLILDFNKAYNPYCAYAAGFNCPVPPAENDLPLFIEAGEMEFGIKH